MSKTFTLSHLTCAIAALSITSVAGAAGLDRSGQLSAQYSESGTQAYISAYKLSPDISGVEVGDTVKDHKIDSLAQDYTSYSYGVKTDVNDTVSVGVFYDQPFGADVKFEGNNTFVNDSNPNDVKSTFAKVHSDNYTGLINVKLGDNFQVYGGPVLEKLQGELELHFNPDKTKLKPEYKSLDFLNGYRLSIPSNTAYGYVAGAAYTKPEIGLKAAITYRSEITHDFGYSETMPAARLPGMTTTQRKESDLTLPKSVNIDFQTGLNRTTLLTARARWVPWSGFTIRPPLLGTNVEKATTYANSVDPRKPPIVKNAPLLAYSDDSYMLELGLAKRLSPALAVSGTIGWDSGAGNPVSPLGPTEGYYSVGLGAKYNFTPNWAISAGGKYLMLGDAEGVLSGSGTKVGKFEDNNAYVVGVKLSYQAK